MNTSENRVDWTEANQRYLMTALAQVRRRLEQHLDRKEKGGRILEPGEVKTEMDLEKLAAAMPAPPALEILCALFGLTGFERQVLLLCAGIELDSAFQGLCAAPHTNRQHTSPTFGLALTALAEPHWSAFSPDRPLRCWRMIEVGNGEGLTQSPLRIDERVLNYLIGVQHLDERLVGYVEPVSVSDDLVPSHDAITERITAAWSKMDRESALPVVQLCGLEVTALRAIAAHACARLGLNLCAMPAQAVPIEPRELTGFMRLWERESALSGSVLLMECKDLDASDRARIRAVSQVIESTHAAMIVANRDRFPIRWRPTVTLDAHRPTANEQATVWRKVLGPSAASLDGHVDALVSQFNLGTAAIQSIAREALRKVNAAGHHNSCPSEELASALWDSSRQYTRPQLSSLAQRIESMANWNDLVLPESQKRTLREIGAHVRQRMKVYDTWGFAAKCSRGLGISALFAGPSGTGKTMAAEVLANELRLDLYRIDLSQVVSKYIGETEKNLHRVFDGAEGSGAILLFDEADALFGKRSEVKDSHDRYANIEIGYLLQRMEAYRGLAILTTNMKNALDQSFLRRLRFIVQFPFPDGEHRAEIWRRVLPQQAPAEGIDVTKLARLSIVGGSIRNIALHAAFLAADGGEPMRMSHLLRAAQVEYGKLEKPLTQSETEGWV